MKAKLIDLVAGVEYKLPDKEEIVVGREPGIGGVRLTSTRGQDLQAESTVSSGKSKSPFGYVSRKQCTIYFTQNLNLYSITDGAVHMDTITKNRTTNPSKHGTYLNGKKLNCVIKMTLSNGDIITFGDSDSEEYYDLQFKFEE